MGHKIAFVDDSASILESIRWTFKDEPFDIYLFQNPLDALRKIGKEEFAAVITDQSMPELDGVTLLQQVREKWPDTIRLIMTAYAEYKIAIDAINQGNVYRFIQKPWDCDEMIEIVKDAIDIYETRYKSRRINEITSEQNNQLLQLNQYLGKELEEKKKKIDDNKKLRRKLNVKLKQAKKMESIGSALSQYVSSSTLRMVEKSFSGRDFYSEKIDDATIIFSDIRGFTNMSEKRGPKEVFELLNRCLSKQIEIIENHNGIIDKIVGDEIMAVFEGEDMAENALRCGARIINELGKKDIDNGVDRISVGIGINTGPVCFGSIGSETMKNYTVVGNTVNISSRLCSYAKKDEVLFSEMTLNWIKRKDFQYRPLGERTFKGLSSPIKVFQVIPQNSNMPTSPLDKSLIHILSQGINN